MKTGTLPRGNPFIASCTITLADGTNSAAAGLTVTAMIGVREAATDPIDAALSVTAVEDGSTPGRYVATFSGDDVTAKLAAFDTGTVWLIFTAPSNQFRKAVPYQVTSAQA